jgi:hypothetical protein
MNANWSSLGGIGFLPAETFVPDERLVAAGQNLDGRLQVFATGSDGAIWHAWQVAPNNGWTAPGVWASRGLAPQSAKLSQPAVAQNLDGRIELFATGDHGTIWHTWQAALNNGWTAQEFWVSRGLAPQGVKFPIQLSPGTFLDG